MTRVARGSVASTSLDFEALPEELQVLLGEIVDKYVIDLEEGRKPERESLLKQNPEIASCLRAYIEQIDWLHAEKSGSSANGESSNGDNTVEHEPWSGIAYEDFEIGPEIGRGAMGIVYRAFQISLQRWVAVKVLPYSSLMGESRTLRFLREAKIAGGLAHPGIVSVYGVGQYQGMCFYAMSLVEGLSLDACIAEAQSIAKNHPTASLTNLTGNLLLGKDRYQRIATLIYEAAEGTAAAHAVGVIHRDIKPSNLIVDQHGHVKLTDFGLATVTGDLDLTRSGEVIGTIRYMSPEQAAGKHGLVDFRSDVYCLGATLYELLTLHGPFTGESLAEVVKQKESGLVKLPRSLESSIPRKLQTIAMKAMRADSTDRYQSAAEFASDLRCFMQGRPISASDRSYWDRSVDWSRRHAGVLLTGVVSLALLFALAVTFNIAQSSQRQALKKALLKKEEHFQSARHAVDQLGVQFADKLEMLPQATELRRDLLRSSLEYYNSFLRDAKNDVSLSKDIAEAKWKVASVTAKLESVEEAEAAYAEADRAFESLTEDKLSLIMRTEMLCDWAMMYMGGFQGEAKSPQKALTVIDRAKNIERQLPNATQALLKNNRAFILASMNRTEEATGLAQDAVLLLRKTDAGLSSDDSQKGEAPGSHSFRSLLVSMLNLCQILDQAGKSAAAIEVSQECASYIKQVSAEKSLDSNTLQQMRADSLSAAANLRWKHQGAHAAVDSLLEVVDLRASLLRKWPGSIEFRWSLAIALNNLGMALSALEDAKSHLEAKEIFSRAYAIAKAEAEADSTSSTSAHRSANIQNNLAMLLRKIGQEAEASAALKSALAHIELASTMDKENEGIRKSRDRIRLNLVRNDHAP